MQGKKLWSIFIGRDSCCSCRETLDLEDESDFGEIKEAFSTWTVLEQLVWPYTQASELAVGFPVHLSLESPSVKIKTEVKDPKSVQIQLVLFSVSLWARTQQQFSPKSNWFIQKIFWLPYIWLNCIHCGRSDRIRLLDKIRKSFHLFSDYRASSISSWWSRSQWLQLPFFLFIHFLIFGFRMEKLQINKSAASPVKTLCNNIIHISIISNSWNKF